MIVGYARTSTTDQKAGLEAQIRDLTTAGAEQIFQEQISATRITRPELDEAIRFVRKGDVLVVTKLDRLARSVVDLLAIVGRLEDKGVGLRVLSMGGGVLDTVSPTGRLMLSLLGAVAEFERTLMLERQREGIAKAKAEGRYRGRPSAAKDNRDKIIQLRNNGFSVPLIASEVGCSVSSIERVLRTVRSQSIA